MRYLKEAGQSMRNLGEAGREGVRAGNERYLGEAGREGVRAGNEILWRSRERGRQGRQ